MKSFNDDEFYSLIDKINGAADRQFDLNNERFDKTNKESRTLLSILPI